MVETKTMTKATLDVKLSLEETKTAGSPIVKRVLASDYETLMNQARALCVKHVGNEVEQCSIRYHDGDNWVIVEDNQDLELAYAIGLSTTNKLIFKIKPLNNVSKQQDCFVPAQEEEKRVQKCGKSIKGIPRKALKNLINNELERQSQDIFRNLLQSDDLPAAQQTDDEASVVHTRISCDGCGMDPIKGLRYKCSVCQNFDFCAGCEERLGHEHAFLKISEDGGAPEVMITMLDEDAEEQDKKTGEVRDDPMQFIRQMMQGLGGGRRGGHGPSLGPIQAARCGRGRFSGIAGPRGPPVHHLMEQIQSKFQQGFGGKGRVPPLSQWRNFKGKHGWKEARAICTRKPEQAVELTPDETSMIELDILNDTYWPWKAGCTLTLSYSTEKPVVEPFSVPIDQEVKGKSTTTFKVPFKLRNQLIVPTDSEHEVILTFRGPKGKPFGAPISINVKVVKSAPQQSEKPKQQVTQIEIYKLAIKLYEQLSLGSLEDCITVVRENNCAEADCIKALQEKKQQKHEK